MSMVVDNAYRCRLGDLSFVLRRVDKLAFQHGLGVYERFCGLAADGSDLIFDDVWPESAWFREKWGNCWVVGAIKVPIVFRVNLWFDKYYAYLRFFGSIFSNYPSYERFVLKSSKVEEFSYHNGVDCTEDVDVSDWSYRGRVWGGLLNGNFSMTTVRTLFGEPEQCSQLAFHRVLLESWRSKGMVGKKMERKCEDLAWLLSRRRFSS